MIRKLRSKGFKAVAHLETSQLMQAHPKGLSFSTTKPNVIVGPNGAGKSAAVTAMSLVTLSNFTGVSSFDDHYVVGRDSDDLWSRERSWGHDYEFLKGLEVDTDDAPAFYFRPGHIPGNEADVTHAMMTGYWEDASAYARLTERKSSGQQGQALLERIHGVLRGESTPKRTRVNWRFGDTPADLDRPAYASSFDYQANVLLKRFGGASEATLPLVLMDEPEQSLDAKAEMQLWSAIASADCTKVQVIAASHSVYPLLHPERFNIIEAVKGYASEVKALLA